MGNIRPRIAWLAILSTILAATGCGGSSGSSKGLSHAQLAAKAEPICNRANQVLESSHINPHNFASVAPQISASFSQAADELAKLDPPSSMSADWNAIVNSWRTAALGLQKMGEAAKTGMTTKPSRLLIEGEAAFTKGQHDRAVTAARNGLDDCSKY